MEVKEVLQIGLYQRGLLTITILNKEDVQTDTHLQFMQSMHK